MPRLTLAIAVATTFASATAMPTLAQEYAPSTSGTRIFQSRQSGLTIKMLVEAANLGSADVEIGEITFPAGADAPQGHRHGSIEIFYVLSGVLEHVVNDETHRLEPGMVGIVRPGDAVIHRVPGDEPVRALVMWAPGGEAARLERFFEVVPIG